MNIALWIVAILVAFAFLAAGFAKLTTPKDALAAKGMAYVEDFSAGQIKAIGALEILGAIGIIGAAFVNAIEFLVPVAATGLVLLMIGAIVVHVRRRESFAPALALGALAAFLAVGRFAVGF